MAQGPSGFRQHGCFSALAFWVFSYLKLMLSSQISSRSQPSRFNCTKTLSTPSLPLFYSCGQLTQTLPHLSWRRIKKRIQWYKRTLLVYLQFLISERDLSYFIPVKLVILYPFNIYILIFVLYSFFIPLLFLMVTFHLVMSKYWIGKGKQQYQIIQFT